MQVIIMIVFGVIVIAGLILIIDQDRQIKKSKSKIRA